MKNAKELYAEIKKYGPKGNGKDIFSSKTFHQVKQESWANMFGFEVGEFQRREYFTANYSWAVPSLAAIYRIIKFIGRDKVLEIGAGKGLWAKLLDEDGVDILAIDTLDDKYKRVGERFFEVKNMKHLEAIDNSTDRNVLFLCWPPYDTKMAYEALNNFKGNKFVYIGEEEGGCNGDDEFFALLSEKWVEKERLHIPQWAGIHDFALLYIKK